MVAGRNPWCSARVAGYRSMKRAGSAINRTIKQTKAAISILLPQCLATDRGFRRRGFLTYDTRASGPKFNRVHRIAPLVVCARGVETVSLDVLYRTGWTPVSRDLVTRCR